MNACREGRGLKLHASAVGPEPVDSRAGISGTAFRQQAEPHGIGPESRLDQTKLLLTVPPALVHDCASWPPGKRNREHGSECCPDEDWIFWIRRPST